MYLAQWLAELLILVLTKDAQLGAKECILLDEMRSVRVIDSGIAVAESRRVSMSKNNLTAAASSQRDLQSIEKERPRQWR